MMAYATKRSLPMLALLAFLPTAAQADTAVKDAANRLSSCVQKRDEQACRENITASSISLFDRFTSYGLMDCLPDTATYISQKPDDDGVQVRANVTTNDKKSTVRLIFQQEEDQWKLDLPETLRKGIGDNWENQVNATEKVYLLLKTQMGDNLNCVMIRNLGSGLTAKTK